jgi:hypothetical protein
MAKRTTRAPMHMATMCPVLNSTAETVGLCDTSKMVILVEISSFFQSMNLEIDYSRDSRETEVGEA